MKLLHKGYSANRTTNRDHLRCHEHEGRVEFKTRVSWLLQRPSPSKGTCEEKKQRRPAQVVDHLYINPVYELVH